MSIVAYHGSFRPRIQVFKPFSHFGTKEAALQRLGDLVEYDPRYKKEKKGYLYELRLNITNPCPVKDNPELKDPPASVQKIAQWCDDLKKTSQIKSYKGINPINGIKDQKGVDILAHFKSLTKSGYWGEMVNNSAQWTELFADFLEETGIDAFKYKNALEDKGSTSYIVLSPKSIKLVGRAKEISLK
jgi:hypothetical protein